jgi:hypothetical protein
VLLELVRACHLCEPVDDCRGTITLSAEEKNMVERQHAAHVVHIRFDGRSLDIPQGELDVGAASSDNEIKRALARYLEVPEAKLRDYVIDRHDTGNMTVRPEAVFG